MIERQHLERMVADQLAMIGNPACRIALRSIRVEPRVEVRDWAYGAGGERYPYWIVAEEPVKGIILVYCEQGFGPEFPWGFLDTGEPEPASLGIDAQWNWYLEEAFVRAGLWDGPMDEALHLPPQERFPTAGPAEER